MSGRRLVYAMGILALLLLLLLPCEYAAHTAC
jgi:hypothetical protein